MNITDWKLLKIGIWILIIFKKVKKILKNSENLSSFENQYLVNRNMEESKINSSIKNRELLFQGISKSNFRIFLSFILYI